MGGKQSQESPSSSPELGRTRPHQHHSHNSNAATWHQRGQGVDNSHSSSALVFHPLSQSYPHLSRHRHRDEDTSQGGPSSSAFTHSHSHRSRDRRAYQYSHPRPDYVDLDFTMPSLDQRLVPRPRSVTGTHDTGIRRRHRTLSSSAPANSILFVRPLSKVKCPLCSREIVSSELEIHLVACVTKPRVMYNVDTLTQDGGECSICLDDMEAGDEIARLPCLCIYHVKCLQQWYRVSQTCPEHPESN